MNRDGSKTWVEISKSALISNARAFRRRIGSSALMAVVKANAYGHGLLETARTLKSHVDWFGVDNVDEAARLRKAGLRLPMLLLGFTPSWRAKEAVRLGARVTVSTVEQARAVRAAAEAAKRSARVHLKVETGTTRQGAGLRELPAVAGILASSKRIVIEGLSTHYANVEEEDRSYASVQLEAFNDAIALLEAHGIRPPVKHTACTAAAILFPDTRFDLVRVGIGMYGIWPSQETFREADRRDSGVELRPVMTWKTVIAQVKEVRRGTPISYGLTEKMPRDGRVAVLPVGYWDGYDRGLSSVGEVLVRGHRCKIMGRVCMNMCMIDVSRVPGIRAEEEVILLGTTRQGSVTAEDLAGRLGTIPYEIVTRVNPTLPRVVV